MPTYQRLEHSSKETKSKEAQSKLVAELNQNRRQNLAREKNREQAKMKQQFAEMEDYAEPEVEAWLDGVEAADSDSFDPMSIPLKMSEKKSTKRTAIPPTTKRHETAVRSRTVPLAQPVQDVNLYRESDPRYFDKFASANGTRSYWWAARYHEKEAVYQQQQLRNEREEFERTAMIHGLDEANNRASAWATSMRYHREKAEEYKQKFWAGKIP